MFQAIKDLPEKPRKKVITLLWVGFFILLILAFIGGQIARGPLPEMIIAPADNYSMSNTVGTL